MSDLVLFKGLFEEDEPIHFGVLLDNGNILCLECGGEIEPEDYKIIDDSYDITKVDEILKEHYNLHPVFITHYEEYAIYEPAEGGYYYAGNQALDWEVYPNLDKAKERLQEILSELKAEDGEFEWHILSNGMEVHCKTRQYIGTNESYVIERVVGSQNRGRVPYC